MKFFKAIIISSLALSLAAAFYGCKKKEEVVTAEPTAETPAETAAAEEIACPAPGEDLICEECGILFQEGADKEYAAHMEEQHPEQWAMVKDMFWEMRKGEGSGAGKQ